MHAGDTLDSHRASLLCLIANNLIENAVAVSPPAAEVRVMLSRQPQSVALTVTDQGPGVPPEVRERLFQPGATGRPGGSGLGLAISHRIARQLGGELELADMGPAGTCFRLTVPPA